MINLKNLKLIENNTKDPMWLIYLKTNNLENTFNDFMKDSLDLFEWFKFSISNDPLFKPFSDLLKYYYKFISEKNIVSSENLKLIELFTLISDFNNMTNYLLRDFKIELVLSSIKVYSIVDYILYHNGIFSETNYQLEERSIFTSQLGETLISNATFPTSVEKATPRSLYSKFDLILNNNFDEMTGEYKIHKYFKDFYSYFSETDTHALFDTREIEFEHARDTKLILMRFRMILTNTTYYQRDAYSQLLLPIEFVFNQNKEEGMFIYSKLKKIKKMYDDRNGSVFSPRFYEILPNDIKNVRVRENF